VNRITSEHLAEDGAIVTHPPITNRTVLIWTAWISTLLLSNLPLIIARDLLGSDIPWIVPAWALIAVFLFVMSYAWLVLRPLRGYFVVMGVIMLLAYANPFIRQTTIWRNLFEGQSQMIGVFADRVMLILTTFFVLAALFLLGVKRKEAFLTAGNLKAIVGGKPSTSEKRGIPWLVFGTAITLLLGGGFFLFMATQNSDWSSNISAVVPWIPLILISAAINAFGEEATFRAAPLATLIPAIGQTHALWLTSIWFGLGHYYGGIPSGLFGFFQTGLIALIMGKAMLDTRGIALPWMIHMILDTIIYFFIAATM